jgi:hypothetical protein
LSTRSLATGLHITTYYVTGEVTPRSFWDLAPCRSCVNRRFGGTYRLYLQGRKIRERGTSVSGLIHTRSTRRQIPEDGILNSHRRENLRTHLITLLNKVAGSVGQLTICLFSEVISTAEVMCKRPKRRTWIIHCKISYVLRRNRRKR